MAVVTNENTAINMKSVTNQSPTNGIGLDIGERRIGVAIANLDVRFARPLTTLTKPEQFIDDIIQLCKQQEAAWIVIGLPRGMQGQDTEQTVRTRAFGAELIRRLVASDLQYPVYWIDEALTSATAESELRSRGKSYEKAEVDALAATYILADYLLESLVTNRRG